MNTKLQQSIEQTAFGHEHASLLYALLEQLTEEEQTVLLELAQRDKEFWIKMVHLVKIMGQTEATTLNDVLNNSMSTFVEELKEDA